MLKLRLKRDLRKNVLRGHPWIYREALEKAKGNTQMCELLDKKGQFLAWGFYDAKSPLAVRILSTKKKPPNKHFFETRMRQAFSLRRAFINADDTNSYRLFNGEGDRLPGLVCDLYDRVAVLQFDGEGSFEFWDQDFIAEWLIENTDVDTVYFKPRRSEDKKPRTWGKELESEKLLIKENGHSFFVNIVDGQKTGFFFDQRENRKYIQSLSRNKTVLNLFSYTGGFSLYAGAGGAKETLSVDLAKEALELANESWLETFGDSKGHSSKACDVFDFVRETTESWDIVIVDPPSMTHSEKNKKSAVKSYVDLFAKASQLVSPQGQLVFSSCSSHISFNDFLEIISEALSQARLTGRILRVSGQGPDHPFPHFCDELRYLKFVHLCLD